MSVRIYTATVKYPASREPYDSGYGPSHNVRLVFDDASAPKTKGGGEVNVYKKVGTRDIDYMLTLVKDDKVQLVWNERDGKGWYDFVIPDDFSVSTPAPQQVAQAVSHGPSAIEWIGPNDTYWAIWDQAIDMETKKMTVALERARELNKTHGTKETADAITIALSIYHKASTHAKPGLVLQSEQATADVDKDATLLLMLDSDDLVNSLLNSVIELSGDFYSASGLKGLLKDLGLSSANITDQDSCLLVAHVAWDYASMVSAGAKEQVALNAVADKHGLIAF